MRAQAIARRLSFRPSRRSRFLLAVAIATAVIGIGVGGYQIARAVPQPEPIPVTDSEDDKSTFCRVSCGGCFGGPHSALRSHIVMEHDATRLHIRTEFELHRNEFIIDRFFRLYILKAMMMMTQQLSAVAMQQMLILGTFLDAKQQLEVQRTMQVLKAEAHRDYRTSIDICVFGTNTRSLAASQRSGERIAHEIARHVETRSTQQGDRLSSQGLGHDTRGRMTRFYTRFCDVKDNNIRFEELCRTPGILSVVQHQESNRDIDYTRSIELPLAFSSSSAESRTHRLDLYPMAANLFGSEALMPPTPKEMELLANRPLYYSIRALAAKRSVAANTFAAIAGSRFDDHGTIGSEPRAYMHVILKQLGLPESESINTYLGTHPSYHAQMEILTKKIYQRPEFYTNLYDTESNIMRKQAAMRAVGLMQNFDMFKSRLRNEAMMAVLVETHLRDLDDAVENRLRGLKKEGARE